MQKLADILPVMTRSLSCHKQYKTQLILYYWKKIVGEDVAVQSTPIGVDFGILSLAVSNSVWCHHLLMMKADLICKINQFIGELIVKDIYFKNNFFSTINQIKDTEKVNLNFSQQLSKIRLNRQEIGIAAHMCEIVRESRLKLKIFRIYKKQMILNKYKKSNDWHMCVRCEVLCPKTQKYCNVCNEKQKKEIAEQIRKLLNEVPWATYSEIYQYVNCSTDDYIDAKISLLQILSEKVDYEDEDSISSKTLTMLFTGAKHEEINSILIKKTIAKFRRKIYVSTSRN